jgi:hypothetical protein
VMEGATAGDPMSAVKWSRKSTRTVSRILRISHTKAWRMLRRAKYRLRFNHAGPGNTGRRSGVALRCHRLTALDLRLPRPRCLASATFAGRCGAG